MCNYDSLVRILVLLADNYHLEIALYVYQCAIFMNNTRLSHEEAIFKNFISIEGTKINEQIFYPTKYLDLDCFVDTEFYGLRGNKNPKILLVQSQ